MLPAGHPGVDHVRQLLQHVHPAVGVLGDIVDTARRATIDVRQALLDPVAIEPDLIEQGRSCPSQVMDGERFKRLLVLTRQLGDGRGDQKALKRALFDAYFTENDRLSIMPYRSLSIRSERPVFSIGAHGSVETRARSAPNGSQSRRHRSRKFSPSMTSSNSISWVSP